MNRLSLLAVLAFASSAFGQGVGPGSPVQSTYTFYLAGSGGERTDLLGLVGSKSNRVGVSLDPAGPVWTKTFQPEISYRPEYVMALDERLRVEGQRPWTGWQMELSSDYRFRPESSHSVAVNDAYYPADVVFQDNIATFSFAPVPVGSKVDLYIKLNYLDSGSSYAPIVVKQFPLPEPTALAMVLIFAPLAAPRVRIHNWCD